ncbi:MAG: AbrB/MazE/SpoVT family DNA-binding domain-containing protein [Candidatus Bathyarchaeia archaeon]
MGLIVKAKVGRKYAVYLPKILVEAAGLKEGEKILLRLVGGSILIEAVKDPITLALEGWKFASVKPEEVEAISVEEQEKYVKGSP